MTDLSVIIPARNEEFLDRTIQDLLENIQADTELIAILDGYVPDPPLAHGDPRLTIIYNPQSVGQRAASNQAAKLAKGKYIMKIDAHCAFDKGFDVKMLEAFKEIGDDVTMVPIMRNLHAFDWVCPEGHRRYQGPSGECKECGKSTVKDVVWIPKTNPASVSYRFDKTMHFQYWGDWGKMQKGDLTESMSLQGSCFMCTKEKYFELDLCSEEFHSWGQQGVEVACKTWLSGGRVIVNRRTWYAHMFRTQGGDFSFPYHNSMSDVRENRELSRELFQHNKWSKAVHDFQWLLDKFHPPEWEETKGIIFYTHNTLDGTKLEDAVRSQLQKISDEKKIPILSASNKKIDFGFRNIYFPHSQMGYEWLFKKVKAALENSPNDWIFFTEHDVLYHPSHFDFKPIDKETFYYNQNVWFLRLPDGHALHYDCSQLSGLCVWKETALAFYNELIEKIEKEGFDRYKIGFEPFTHKRVQWKHQFKTEVWKSEFPNVDIKHGGNATGQRWKKEQYRNQNLLVNWTESDTEIPGWGSTQELVKLLQ